MKHNNLTPWNVNEDDYPKNGSLSSKIKFIARYALLAPSGHNSQPWIFKISGSRFEILPDFSKIRFHVDPDNRELFISLGAAAANFSLAADYFGLIYKKTYRLDHPNPGFIFDFVDGRTKSRQTKLFKSITLRQTNRFPFKAKSIPKTTLSQIQKLKIDPDISLDFIHHQSDRLQLSKLVFDSSRIWFKSKELVGELENWLRDDLEMSKDGLPTGVLNLYKLAINIKFTIQKEPLNLLNKAEIDRDLAVSSPLSIIISSKDDSLKNWLKTGEMLSLLTLKLTSLSLAHGYFNSVIELNTSRSKLARLFSLKTRPQLLLRTGYATKLPPHSPRAPLSDILK